MKTCILIFLTAIFLAAGGLPVSGLEPVVIWTSHPVEPGEAIMVFGGPWTDVSSVQLTGPEAVDVKPLRVTDDCVTFLYPEKWPRATFTARIVDASGVAETRVNAPDAWWIHGDLGRTATVGGWLRVFGRSIGYGQTAGVELANVNRTVRLKTADCDLYTLRVDLPADILPGVYTVTVSNGFDTANAGTIEVRAPSTPWPQIRFNVVDYGAVPNDRIDDSHAIRAALAALKANGGGILFFPRGRFGMSGTIELPPNTLLCGETAEQGSAGEWKNGRMEEWEGTTPPRSPRHPSTLPLPHSSIPSTHSPILLSQIYWIDEDDPQDALVVGTHDFAIQDIALVAGNIGQGIVTRAPGPGESWKNENILLDRVRTRFLHTDAGTAEERFRRSQQPATVLRLHGDNIRVYDCDITGTKGATGITGNHLDIRGNRFQGSGQNQTLHFAGNYIIWENNNHESSSTTLTNDSRCIYFRNNSLGAIYGDGDRESFTFDGGGGTYKDMIASAAGNTVELNAVQWRHGEEHWIGKSIYVIGGKGAGQMRTITSVDGTHVEVDRPWDIALNETSFVVIAQARHRLLFLDNTVQDGNPFQFYGSAIDAVLAGNRAARNSGIPVYGMTKGGWPEPSWFIQFIGNEILEGNSVRGPWSFIVPAEDSYLAFFDRGIYKPLTYPQARVGVMRRNILHSNAYLYGGPRVENILVENNLVKHADRGVVIQSKGAVIRGNRFEDVLVPYVVSDDAVLDPAERQEVEQQAAETARRTGNAASQAEKPQELIVTQFLVAGPFKNAGGRGVDTEIHPPEMDLDVRRSHETLEGVQPWRPAKADARGNANLADVFGKTEQCTASVVAVVEAVQPVRVNVGFGSNTNTLAVVNGERIGSSARRPGPAFVELQKGLNLFHLITSNDSGPWPITLRLTILDPVQPEALRVLSIEELFACPVLQPTRTANGSGPTPANDMGVDWQLVVSDTFDRTRVGTHWREHFDRPGHISTGLRIRDRALSCYGGTATVAYARQKTPPPVRIEFDVWLETPRSQFGVILRRTDLQDGPEHYEIAPLGLGHRLLMRNGQVVLTNRQGGIYPEVTPDEWHHIVVQFTELGIQFFYNGQRRFDFEDTDRLDGLDQIALWFDTSIRIDNLEIYRPE